MNGILYVALPRVIKKQSLFNLAVLRKFSTPVTMWGFANFMSKALPLLLSIHLFNGLIIMLYNGLNFNRMWFLSPETTR